MAWAALLMVLVQFAVVLMRYVFGVSSIWMQESIFYMHGLLFMVAAAYTLKHDAHVRVDILYRDASPAYKAKVDLAGIVLFLWPVCALIVMASWGYVSTAWMVLEGSRETSGIPAIFLLKSVIIVFAVFVAAQGLAAAIHAINILTGRETPAEASGDTF